MGKEITRKGKGGKVELSGIVDEITVQTKTGALHLVKAKRIAELLGYTEINVRKMARNEQLPHYKIGCHYWFNIEEILSQAKVPKSEKGD